MQTTVVLIHSGIFFPFYINDCIKILQKNNIDIRLLLSKDLHKYINSDSDINLEVLEDYEDNHYKEYHIQGFSTLFKDKFYERTSSRFFILANYDEKRKLKSFFHIENDVAIFSDLTTEKKILDGINKEMAVVIDSNKRCVPSIVWFKDYNIINSLSDFIFINNTFTDMENLFRFFYSNKNNIINLPIIDSDEFDTDQIKYCNFFNEFNSIFDGAAIGQYLFGIDDQTKNTVGFINETNVFNVSRYSYIWEGSQPYMINRNGSKIKINNLHIHCKNLKQLL
jgi:hypothetical protein